MRFLLAALLFAISYAQTGSACVPQSRERYRSEEESSCVKQDQTRTCNHGQLGEWSGDFTAKKCRTKNRRTYDTDCKKTCSSGWNRYATFGHGCCSSVFACGGERERCEQYVYGDWQYVHDKCYAPETLHGGEATRVQYLDSAVNAPDSCISEEQTMTCSDGIWDSWSGTYQHSSCEIRDQCESPTTPHGGTTARTRYRESFVTFQNTCASETQTKTCSNGDWSSWSGTYTFASCTKQDTPTRSPTPSPTGIRLCEIPEYFSTDCDTILYNTECEIKYDACNPGLFAQGVVQECTESGWVGPELDPNCQARTCVLPSRQPNGVQYGNSPALTKCSSVDCDDYDLNDVECIPGHKISLTKCTEGREYVTIECCHEDGQGDCLTLETLDIFENFYHGIDIKDPFGSTYGRNIFEVAVEVPSAEVYTWEQDLIETSKSIDPFYFLVENQFSETATGARGSFKSTTKSYAHYGEYVEHNSKEVETSVEINTSLMKKAKTDSSQSSTSLTEPEQYGSVGVAGSNTHNRKEGRSYSNLVKFRASEFDRKQVFGTWRFDPDHPNVQINPNLVSALENLQPYSADTEFQYRDLFDQYGTHYASTFDLGYEVNGAEFSSECESTQGQTSSTSRETCFEASFVYKFTDASGGRCVTKTKDTSSEQEQFMSFETATFEVRGGDSDTNRILVDALREMKQDVTTKRTQEYNAWVESTYKNPGIVGFKAEPIWNLVSGRHPSLKQNPKFDPQNPKFDPDLLTRLRKDMEDAFYAILQREEDAYRSDWCQAECNCGIEVDPISCSCNTCFETFVSADCCVQSSTINSGTCQENSADTAQLGFAIFALLYFMF